MPARRFSRMVPLAICLCLGTGSLMAGCGQKGPLFLPAQPEVEPATATDPVMDIDTETPIGPPATPVDDDLPQVED